MFAAIAVFIAFVLGTLVDKILFLLTVLFLWHALKALARSIKVGAARKMAALRHRLRFIFGPTVVIKP